MERIFLFCFRSCLKGEGDSEYYDVLETDSGASLEVIKRQYKKQSLALHPVSHEPVFLKAFLTVFFCFRFIFQG